MKLPSDNKVSIRVRVELSPVRKKFGDQARARELARSGTFIGWRPIAFELQFEPGFTEAYEWIHSASAQEELDSICLEARMLRYVDRHGPKAA